MSEIRALLLTDVIDSTRLSQELGDLAMAQVWTAHDRVARGLLTPWRGREIDKTDGMLLLFESAADAVGYAIEYHRALTDLPVPLQARAGLHVGAVILRENAEADVARGAKPIEVEGIAKPIAARLTALAQAAQTLLSAAAIEQLGKTSMRAASHGHWMLKGVAEPMELFEVGHPDGPPFVQPLDGEKAHRVLRVGDWWLPVREIPHNLPHQPTSFIGRERELGDVKALLRNARLVTLLGMGGLGKTRLSLQVAAGLIHEFPDGVWFIDLAPIVDPALVAGETARVVGVREEPDRPVLETLCAHLKSRRALLILDNCEHLVNVSAELASAVLRAAPNVRILASSRESLRSPGEHTYPVLPLPIPSRDSGVDVLARSTAVRLFTERAQMHRPGFSVGEREAPVVAELVARLEGIPLALELAAARVRSLSLADINARLKDRYKLLTGGSRVVMERQQTLRALVDWSYELLEPVEQIVLERLGVFVGGFDLAAAEPVCAGGLVEADDVLDLLGALVDKSIVTLEERNDGARYRMLETIRDYAREKLAARADARAVAGRHCDHYFKMAKAANTHLNGPTQADWIWKVEIELDNVRSAVALSVAGGVDPFIAVKFAVALQGFWTLRGYATEGRMLVRSLLAVPAIQESALARAWALYVGAALAESQSDHTEARRMLETCLALRRDLGNPVDIAATLSTLSLARLQARDVDAATEGETEALQIFRSLGDSVGEAIGLLHLGQIKLRIGDDAAARANLEQGRKLAIELAHREVEGECELLLGELALENEDLDDASARFERSHLVCREGGDKRGVANALLWLGRLDLERAELDSARQRLGDALRNFRSFEMWDELLCCLDDHAKLARASGETRLAVCLGAAVAASRERLALGRSPKREARWQRHLNALRQMLPEAQFRAAWDEAHAWQIEQAIAKALSPIRAAPTQTPSEGGLPEEAAASAVGGAAKSAAKNATTSAATSAATSSATSAATSSAGSAADIMG